MKRRTLLAAGMAPLLTQASRAAAQDVGTAPLRIGVLTDETGPYADSAGPGSVLAARMAAADYGGDVRGARIEILHADTQNKPDIAASVARRWFDTEGVDAIVDLPVTPVALAVQQIAREKNCTVMITASAISEFTSKYCSPVSTHWADDTRAMTIGITETENARGDKSWFFITVDMQFGHDLQEGAAGRVTANGGKVLGSAPFPIGTTDFASQLLQAQSSGADVIGLAAVGGDLVNLIKQAHEFGIGRNATPVLATFLVYINDIHALGLPVAQGLEFVASFYWDQNDTSRAFARRFMAVQNAMPSKDQALVYVAVRHFLGAVERAGTREAVAVGKAMRLMKVDYLGRPALLREDGRLVYPVPVWRVKSPAESQGPWDYYTRIGTIPSGQAFLPMNPACL
jgi:branched-chain amino acid transport system substrate-binding protein